MQSLKCRSSRRLFQSKPPATAVVESVCNRRCSYLSHHVGPPSQWHVHVLGWCKWCVYTALPAGAGELGAEICLALVLTPTRSGCGNFPRNAAHEPSVLRNLSSRWCSNNLWVFISSLVPWEAWVACFSCMPFPFLSAAANMLRRRVLHIYCLRLTTFIHISLYTLKDIQTG